jgi:hypothetical protein
MLSFFEWLFSPLEPTTQPEPEPMIDTDIDLDEEIFGRLQALEQDNDNLRLRLASLEQQLSDLRRTLAR